MIGYNIDGSVAGGTNQLLDLLKVVADPAAYEAKIAELNALITKGEATMKLVGPADEILAAREEVKADKAEAKEALRVAKAKAADMVREAEEKVQRLEQDAQQRANEQLKAVLVKLADTATAEAEAKEAADAARKAEAAAKRNEASAKKRADELKVELEKARKAREEADAYKKSVADKHSAFIASL